MAQSEFEKLTQVVKALRDPKTGCPWDLEQTHDSLLKYLLEESYEFIEACEKEDFQAMEEELGDVLLQVLLHSQVASEAKKFDLESLSKKLREKLIRRHPHVFDRPDASISTDEVISNWEEIKKQEAAQKNQTSKTHIKNSLINHPALFSAYKIGKKTQKINFDWDDPMQVAYKVEEEWQELKEELGPSLSNSKMNMERIGEELGDVLFSMAQLARHLGQDPEQCLRKANKKFIRRFQAMEKLIVSERGNLDGMKQHEMDVYWMQAKKQE